MASSLEDVGINDTQGIQNYIQQHGVSGMGDFFKTKLDQWKHIEIRVGVTGDAGAGKSSFINAIRGLPDDDEKAAPTGVTETTREKTAFAHPTNPKIILYDLPGIGTKTFKNFESYCNSEKVELESYHFFLIFADNRFTLNDWRLAERAKSLEKPFFFIRTKIDQDRNNEKQKKTFNEEEMLNKIREDCLDNLNGSESLDGSENLDGLEIRVEDVFLISNHHPTKWDFPRLTQAILDALPLRLKECLTLSLPNLSANILKEKVKTLKGRVWIVAAASAAGAAFPFPGLSIAMDVALLVTRVKFYKLQLGIPDEDSAEFRAMSPRNQERVRKYCLSVSNLPHIVSLLGTYLGKSLAEELLRFIPFVGSILAANVSFSSTLFFLNDCLDDLEEIALAHLDEMFTKAVDDTDIE